MNTYRPALSTSRRWLTPRPRTRDADGGAIGVRVLEGSPAAGKRCAAANAIPPRTVHTLPIVLSAPRLVSVDSRQKIMAPPTGMSRHAPFPHLSPVLPGR